MPKIPKTKADRKADKKALKKAMKKHIARLSSIRNEFWYNEGWVSLEDFQKASSSIHTLENKLRTVGIQDKWISDEDFAALNESTEPESEGKAD